MIKQSILLLTLIGCVGTTKPALSDWIPNFCKNGYQTITKISTPQPVSNFFRNVRSYCQSMLSVVKKHPLLCGITCLSVASTAYCYSKYRSLKTENGLLQRQHEGTSETLRQEQITREHLQTGIQQLERDNERLKNALQENIARFQTAAARR